MVSHYSMQNSLVKSVSYSTSVSCISRYLGCCYPPLVPNNGVSLSCFSIDVSNYTNENSLGEEESILANSLKFMFHHGREVTTGGA